MIREIKKDGKKIGYDVQVSARHPVTRERKFLRRTVETKWDAQKVETELKVELQSLFNGTKIPSFIELVAQYEREQLAKKAASTKHNELSIIECHLKPQLERKELKDVTKDDVEAILDRLPPDRSLSTKHNIRKTLSNIFKFAKGKRYMLDNPCLYVKLAPVKRDVPNLLSTKEIGTLLRQAEKSQCEWFPIWAFGIYTGMRSGELFALRWRHLQENNGRYNILVRESWTKKGGFKPCPKDGDFRSIPVNKALRKVIDQLRTDNPNAKSDDFILPRISAWKQGDAAKELRAFLRGCNLPKMRFHDLRACFITQLLMRGIAPAVVMKMSGHEDMETMMIYCRMCGADIIDQTEVLDFPEVDKNNQNNESFKSDTNMNFEDYK